MNKQTKTKNFIFRLGDIYIYRRYTFVFYTKIESIMSVWELL